MLPRRILSLSEFTNQYTRLKRNMTQPRELTIVYGKCKTINSKATAIGVLTADNLSLFLLFDLHFIARDSILHVDYTRSSYERNTKETKFLFIYVTLPTVHEDS